MSGVKMGIPKAAHWGGSWATKTVASRVGTKVGNSAHPWVAQTAYPMAPCVAADWAASRGCLKAAEMAAKSVRWAWMRVALTADTRVNPKVPQRAANSAAKTEY